MYNLRVCIQKIIMIIHIALVKKINKPEIRIYFFLSEAILHNSFHFFDKRNKLMFFILTRRMPLKSALQITRRC